MTDLSSTASGSGLPSAPAPAPSLLPREARAGHAYELKFLLDPALAARAQQWAIANLRPDPYGDPALGGAYRTTTLYFDTPSLDVYHRTPTFRRRKYRIRRYGLTSWVHLERKTKSQDRVSKRRCSIAEHQIGLLSGPTAADPWPGDWFHRRITMKDLRPAARISYLRTAYIGQCPEGPLRLTLDREIQGVLTPDWRLAPLESGVAARRLLPDAVILELKFVGSVPSPFKRLIQDLALAPAQVSKYRLCRDAWAQPGIRPAAPAADPSEARRA